MKNYTVKGLSEFMERYNLSRQELADLVGVSVAAIYKWQEGVRKPSKSVLLLMERIEAESKMKGGEKHGKGNIQKK